MRPVTYTTKELTLHFYERKILTKKQILQAVGCSSMTAWRLIKELGYLTSYNFNSRYYTLRDIPHFDKHGLWSYRKVRFSKYGTLTKTVTMLVTQSVSGLTMADLRTLLQVNVTPTLIRLYQRDEIARTKIGPVYLYVSSDVSQRQSQLKKHHQARQKAQDRQILPEPERIIAVFVELIKAVNLEQDQVLRRLRSQGISITKDELQRIWLHYGLSKKKRL